MTQQTQQPTQRPERAATLATTAALAKDLVVLQRRQQEAVAAARAIYHRAQLHRARRQVANQRRQGRDPGPLAWFAVQGLVDDQVVRAVWADGRLCCDRLLESRARLLVDLGAEFGCEEDPPRYQASLQAPPMAVLLTLIRACDRATTVEFDLGAGDEPRPHHRHRHGGQWPGSPARPPPPSGPRRGHATSHSNAVASSMP